MNILEVNKFYYPWLGGVEKAAQQLAEGLSGHNNVVVKVLCCQARGHTIREKINDVEVVRASSWGVLWRMPISFSFFVWFKKLSQEADIIDLHHPFPLAFLAFFLFRPKGKLVVHYHSDIVKQKFLGFLLLPIFSYVLNRATSIIISNPNLQKNSSLLRRYQKKCQVIHLGVDIKELELSKDNQLILDIKRQYGNFVLFVGRLIYYKGLEYLLSALVETDIKLVIIGQGNLENNLRTQVEKLGLTGQVYFLPPQDRKILINFYYACDGLILPSIYPSETFGIVLLEAMACGKLVVSTDLGTGTSYVNVDRNTGWVVPPRDVGALRKALVELIFGSSNANMEINARVRAQTEFLIDGIIRKHLDFYRKLV